jgi:hypothetical protein
MLPVAFGQHIISFDNASSVRLRSHDVARVSGDTIRERGFTLRIRVSYGGFTMSGLEAVVPHLFVAHGADCATCFTRAVVPTLNASSLQLDGGATFTIRVGPQVQYSANGNETVALNMSMIAAMANCETRITRLTLNVVDPLPKITGARISSREVHPLQPVLLTLSGHGLRADHVYSDTLFVVPDSVACTVDVNAASPLVLAAVSGPFPSSGTSSLNRHTVNITFNLTSTGTHRLCWRFNRTGAVSTFPQPARVSSSPTPS